MTFLAQFSIELANILPFARSDLFPAKFAAMFKILVPTDNVMIIAYPNRKLPVIEHNDLPPNDKTSIVGKFVAGAFILDPYYLAATKTAKRGFFHLSEVAPENFKESEYNQVYFKHSGLSDECGYLLRLGEEDNTFINISLGQISNGETFNAQHLQNLAEITPLIEAIAKYHWQADENDSDTQLDMRKQLETALECFGTSILTERENQMVQMILHGYSSKAIAERFGISVETVKLHRKNAYAKLDLGTQGELFNLFINSLMNIEHYEGGDPLISYHCTAAEASLLNN
ncbi:MAG: DNA-binding CsgD family transcriptional regulator [Enterobacterales bacterium]|jgi:DNA-binding CsgD family transcriptional regulator